MCFAGIETEIRNLPERELPAAPKPVDPDRTVPRTLSHYPSRPPDTLPKQPSPSRAEPQAA